MAFAFLALILCAAILLQLRTPRNEAKKLEDLIPIYKIEDDLLVSKQGDITAVFKIELPEVFSLSSEEYDGLHHTWVRAIRLLPAGTILHKQDWFTEARYQGKFDTVNEPTFIQQESERFFHERPMLDHDCYVMITKKATGRKLSSSVFTNLLRPSLIPPSALSEHSLSEFGDRLGQFAKLLSDGGWMKVTRLTTAELAGSETEVGLLERYLFLANKDETPLIRDIHFKPEMKIGDKYCQIYAMADVEDLPSMAGSRITYDKYSSDKTKFSVGFAAPVGQLLSCNHIYNQ
ncbi:DUF3875 domain-containing protein [Chitinophaga sedimenti]|uniref:DUF3875 domain-containing protein n=1 Tax=Chitinophaga sedimenti TaxID=2033606 RepID=UPI002004AFA3|nr:DUF3875 domain-containing protein [Chitinophaga sedimenti]MCK7559438.1 DUF3875 domain-containing protein [Chitinophaga sedimenti]